MEQGSSDSQAATAPAITAIAPWFGGKRTLAATIVEELGTHRAYWEPFCGSMAVLLAKGRSAHETVNDLHGDLINLAMVVASDRWRDLHERLARTLVCEAIFAEARRVIAEPIAQPPQRPGEVTDADIERAYWYFIVAWMGRNGVSGTHRYNYQMAIRWTPGGGHGGLRVASATDSLPWWHRRIRRVTILCRDAFEVIPKIDDVDGVAVYVDPPYMAETRQGAKYVHDLDADGQGRLAELLGRFRKARVVVSHYDHPALDDLYRGWTKRAVYTNKNLHVQNRRGSTKTVAPEVLLINGPSCAPGAAGLFDGGEGSP